MFRQLGLSSLFAATLLVSACKSKSQDAAPAPVPPSATAAPAGKPAEVPPVTDDTLSFAQPEGGKCKWVRLEAGRGARRDIFTFEGGCEHAQFAWSPDGRKGAVLLGSEDQRPPRAWTVDFATGQGTALPLPEVGRTTELGFDVEGRPVALVAHHASPHMKPPERAEKDGESVFVFEGKQYPSNASTEAGLAHAYRREGDTWKHVETQATEFGSDSSEGTQVLDLAKKLGPNTKLAPKDGLPQEGVSEEEQTALNEAAEAELMGPRSEDLREGTSWTQSRLPGGPIYYRTEESEVINASPPMRWNVGGTFVEPEKLSLPGDAPLSLENRGSVLLITTARSVRLYDVKKKKQLLSLEGVSLPFFWPRPDTTSGKPGSPRLKLDDAQVALDFLEKSSLVLAEAGESCAQQVEAGTLGALAKKARADYAQASVQCEAQKDSKTWACKAQFTSPGNAENPDGSAMKLQYSVDDATRTVPPSSLVCQIAG
jgi:hypothetical protein